MSRYDTYFRDKRTIFVKDDPNNNQFLFQSWRNSPSIELRKERIGENKNKMINLGLLLQNRTEINKNK
jgi:hypothetical protein